MPTSSHPCKRTVSPICASEPKKAPTSSILEADAILTSPEDCASSFPIEPLNLPHCLPKAEPRPGGQNMKFLGKREGDVRSNGQTCGSCALILEKWTSGRHHSFDNLILLSPFSSTHHCCCVHLKLASTTAVLLSNYCCRAQNITTHRVRQEEPADVGTGHAA